MLQTHLWTNVSAEGVIDIGVECAQLRADGCVICHAYETLTTNKVT